MIHLLAKTLRLSKCLSDALHLITQSWLNCLEKLSFFGCWKSLSAASKCRKTHPCDYRIWKFSGGTCPRTPLGGKAQGPCQFFARVSNSVALLLKTLMNPLVMTIGLSINGCSHSKNQFDEKELDWLVQKFGLRRLQRFDVIRGSSPFQSKRQSETFRFEDEDDYEYEIWLKAFSLIRKI